jgi:hypothetical protein
VQEIPVTLAQPPTIMLLVKTNERLYRGRLLLPG